MAGNKRGGVRPGAGRKPTGRTRKCITLTLPVDVAERLAAEAKAKGVTMSTYVLESLSKFETMIDEEAKPYTKD